VHIGAGVAVADATGAGMGVAVGGGTVMTRGVDVAVATARVAVGDDGTAVGTVEVAPGAPRVGATVWPATTVAAGVGNSLAPRRQATRARANRIRQKTDRLLRNVIFLTNPL